MVGVGVGVGVATWRKPAPVLSRIGLPAAISVSAMMYGLRDQVHVAEYTWRAQTGWLLCLGTEGADATEGGYSLCQRTH